MATRQEIKPGQRGRGPRHGSHCGRNVGPSGTFSGKGVRDSSRSILIDKGGNYISLGFSANPHGPAGDTERETKRSEKERIMEGKVSAKIL